MTMRLSGDRLSVVVRAASGQTASAIETARDAIAERLAAIGQPIASFIVQETGPSAGETTHARDSSSDSGQKQGQSDSRTDGSRSDRRGRASRGF